MYKTQYPLFIGIILLYVFNKTNMSTSGDHDDEGYVIKMRGLPWSTTFEEILKFFDFKCNMCSSENTPEQESDNRLLLSFRAEEWVKFVVPKSKDPFKLPNAGNNTVQIYNTKGHSVSTRRSLFSFVPAYLFKGNNIGNVLEYINQNAKDNATQSANPLGNINTKMDNGAQNQNHTTYPNIVVCQDNNEIYINEYRSKCDNDSATVTKEIPYKRKLRKCRTNQVEKLEEKKRKNSELSLQLPLILPQGTFTRAEVKQFLADRIKRVDGRHVVLLKSLYDHGYNLRSKPARFTRYPLLVKEIGGGYEKRRPNLPPGEILCRKRTLRKLLQQQIKKYL